MHDQDAICMLIHLVNFRTVGRTWRSDSSEGIAMGLTYKQLREMPKERLIAKHDELAGSTIDGGVQMYRDELALRETNELNVEIHAFTRQMRNMTIFISGLTFVACAAAIASLCITLMQNSS